MEATTLLTLILLAAVGAKNIPINMDEPSGKIQKIIGDSITSYTKSVNKGEVFYKDPVEDAVNAGALEPTSNKDINKGTVEAKNLESKPKEDENQETTTAANNPVEVTIDDKEAQEVFEDREGLKGDNCPGGTKIGYYWKIDKSLKKKV